MAYKDYNYITIYKNKTVAKTSSGYNTFNFPIIKEGEFVPSFESEIGRQGALNEWGIFTSDPYWWMWNRVDEGHASYYVHGVMTYIEDNPLFNLKVNAVGTIDVENVYIQDKNTSVDGLVFYVKAKIVNYKNSEKKSQFVFTPKSTGEYTFYVVGGGEFAYTITDVDTGSEIVRATGNTNILNVTATLTNGHSYYIRCEDTTSTDATYGGLYGIKSPTPNGVDNDLTITPFFEDQTKIYVSTDQDLTDAHYARIQQAKTGNVRYYFVDKVNIIQDKGAQTNGLTTFELNISLDVWQSHFFCGNASPKWTSTNDFYGLIYDSYYNIVPPKLIDMNVHQTTMTKGSIYFSFGSLPLPIEPNGEIVNEYDVSPTNLYWAVCAQINTENAMSGIAFLREYHHLKTKMYIPSSIFAVYAVNVTDMDASVDQAANYLPSPTTFVYSNADVSTVFLVPCVDGHSGFASYLSSGTPAREGTVKTKDSQGNDMTYDYYGLDTRLDGIIPLRFDEVVTDAIKASGQELRSDLYLTFGNDLFSIPCRIIKDLTTQDWVFDVPKVRSVQSMGSPSKLIVSLGGAETDISDLMTFPVSSNENAKLLAQNKEATALSYMTSILATIGGAASGNILVAAGGAASLSTQILETEKQKHKVWMTSATNPAAIFARQGFKVRTYNCGFQRQHIDYIVKKYGFIYDIKVPNITIDDIKNHYIKSNGTNYSIYGIQSAYVDKIKSDIEIGRWIGKIYKYEELDE